MGFFPLYSSTATKDLSFGATDLTGHVLKDIDARKVSITLEGVASGDAPAYTASIDGTSGIPEGGVVRFVLAETGAETVPADSFTVTFKDSSNSTVTKAMTAENDEFTIICVAQGQFESFLPTTFPAPKADTLT